MKKLVGRAVVAAAILMLGLFAWQRFSPSPEMAIRNQMAAVARTASFSSHESALAKLSNSQKLAAFCTEDVEITIEVPGRSQQTFGGRPEVEQAAMGARSALGSLNIEFLDLNVTLGTDKSSAVVNLTAKGKLPYEKDILVQELKFSLKKMKGEWLINRVETVKTLL